MQKNMQWHSALHAVMCRVFYGSYSMQLNMQWHSALHAVLCRVFYGSYSMQLNMQWHSILHAVLWHAIDYAMAIGIAWRVVACK